VSSFLTFIPSMSWQTEQQNLFVVVLRYQGFSIPLGAAPGKIYDTDVGVLSKLCALHPGCVGFEIPRGVLLSNVAEAARSHNTNSTLYTKKGAM
jgi:hypothetical protein